MRSDVPSPAPNNGAGLALKRAGTRGQLTPKTLKKIGDVIDKAVHDIEAAFDEDR